MKKGDVLELDIKGYAFEGKGLAKIPFEDVFGDSKESREKLSDLVRMKSEVKFLKDKKKAS